MFEKTIFGFRLRELRQGHKISVPQLADTFKIHKGTVSNLELGKKSPSIDLAVALADYFNVSLDYLVGRSDNPDRR
ncbi:helix-turn-helix domain-containing protein [Acetonema longum]|uniref:XRE family transcriptional regulator n=1 Tax=Acetonema longum DSM 6540 TaxID=1009370 RepID=F7NLM5_9FIRM|nr:helix-turn-helix transcriptional regulator [Acetonema longum]EGO63047.1 XRE family transcriptional regulator [Acetonema longum DSM 6540]